MERIYRGYPQALHAMERSGDLMPYMLYRREEQAVLQSMCWMAFIGCEYLEMQHRYKKNGMEKFLKFLKGRMEEIGEDEQYFKDVIEYYKSTYDLDDATIMGVKIG